MEGKLSNFSQTFNVEMSRMEDIRKTANTSVLQVQDFKETLTKRIDKQIEEYRCRVDDLELP